MNHRMPATTRPLFLLLLALALVAPGPGLAATAREIDARVDEALERFVSEVEGGREFLTGSAGVLVFPRVVKAGLLIGGEYGEGALRVGGETVDYYSTTAGSIGLQAGAQAKTVVIVFVTRPALERFRQSSGWKAGVDGSVALIDMGAGRSLDTINVDDPIVGFVFGQKGLMFNATLEGSKFTRLDK